MCNEQIGIMCFSLVMITLILSSLSYCQNNDRLIAEALKSGQDPQAIQCAFKANLNTVSSPACLNYRRP